MSLRKEATRAAASAAGIAAATAGLSTCMDGGGIVVDPVPPPLTCSSLSAGQTLVASAQRIGDSVSVGIRNQHYSSWTVTRVGDATGGTLVRTVLPRENSSDSLLVVVQLATSTTAAASFVVEATLKGTQNDSCTLRRTFILTIAAGGVQVTMADEATTPMVAYGAAQILLRGQRGATVDLEARSNAHLPGVARWEASAGRLSASEGARVSWTLPDAPGLYQIELVVDHGDAGATFDSWMVERQPT